MNQTFEKLLYNCDKSARNFCNWNFTIYAVNILQYIMMLLNVIYFVLYSHVTSYLISVYSERYVL